MRRSLRPTLLCRRKAGGPGERQRRDRGGKSQRVKSRPLQGEAGWEKEDADACFLGGLHSFFFFFMGGLHYFFFFFFNIYPSFLDFLLI